MKSLFVGGCVDGEHIETQGEERRYAASLRGSFFSQEVFSDDARPLFREELYIRVPFSAGGSQTYIYAHESLAKQTSGPDELAELVLHRLISGYRKPEGEQRQRPTPESTGDAKSFGGLKELDGEEFKTRLKRAMEEAPKFKAESKPRTAAEQELLASLASKKEMLSRMYGAMPSDCRCPICEFKRKIERGETPTGIEIMQLIELLAQAEQAEQMEAQDRARSERATYYDYQREVMRTMEGAKWSVEMRQLVEEMRAPPRKRPEQGKLARLDYDYRSKNQAPKSVRKGK